MLDLDGDGLEFVARALSTAFFDADGDGFRENMGWLAPDDGFLVTDLDGDGTVSAPEELIIAAQSPDPDDTDLEALARLYDSNRDGVLDARDADWETLLVWQDLDQDGAGDEGELRSLGEAGIRSIDLARSELPAAEQDRAGNTLFATARYTAAGGGTGLVGDAALAATIEGYRELRRADGSSEIELEAGERALVAAPGQTLIRDAAVAGHRGLFGADGDDTLFTTSDRDVVLSGGGGEDRLVGDGGDDWLVGGPGADRLSGRGGHDILFVDAADTAIVGGDGFDVALVASKDGVTLDMAATELEAAFGNDGDDRFSAAGAPSDSTTGQGVVLDGGGGDDTLTGGPGADILLGGDGADVLDGGGGADVLGIDAEDAPGAIDGGAGIDVAFVTDARGVLLDMAASQIEIAVGNAGKDVFLASNASSPAEIFGAGGNDVLAGSALADVLRGGAGDDTLAGGAGGDTFLWARDTRGDDFDGGVDRILDFTLGEDVIRLDGVLDGFKHRRSLGKWVRLTHVQADDGARAAAASLIAIDRDGLRDFANPDQLIELRGDPLARFKNAKAMARAGALQVTRSGTAAGLDDESVAPTADTAPADDAPAPSLAASWASTGAMADGVITAAELSLSAPIDAVSLTAEPGTRVMALFVGETDSVAKTLTAGGGADTIALTQGESLRLGDGPVAVSALAQDTGGRQTLQEVGSFQLELGPVLAASNLDFTETVATHGTTVTVSEAMLGVSDFDTPARQVTITVGNVEHGTFQLKGRTATSFTLADVQAGKVSFHQPLTESRAPAFDIAASDGPHTAAPRAAGVTYTPLPFGKILWGDGSGDGQGRTQKSYRGGRGETYSWTLTTLGEDGGGDDDTLTGTAHGDILFGDGSGGGAGLGGGGNDTLLAGAGNDILFGDGFAGGGTFYYVTRYHKGRGAPRGSYLKAKYVSGEAGYGGGGADARHSDSGIGGGEAREKTSWLGPAHSKHSTAGAGVRAGDKAALEDPVAHALGDGEAASAERYGGRSVYDKVLWDLSEGTPGFGTGSAASDAAGRGHGGTNVDERPYAQATGAGTDSLRGGPGDDWMMGGGGPDTFRWAEGDMDGGTDYIVDFAPGDVIDISEVLTGYSGPEVSVAPWAVLSTGLSEASPFEGGTGPYSRLEIDTDRNGVVDQTILLRGDPLAGFADADAMAKAGALAVI